MRAALDTLRHQQNHAAAAQASTKGQSGTLVIRSTEQANWDLILDDHWDMLYDAVDVAARDWLLLDRCDKNASSSPLVHNTGSGNGSGNSNGNGNNGGNSGGESSGTDKRTTTTSTTTTRTTKPHTRSCPPADAAIFEVLRTFAQQSTLTGEDTDRWKRVVRYWATSRITAIRVAGAENARRQKRTEADRPVVFSFREFLERFPSSSYSASKAGAGGSGLREVMRRRNLTSGDDDQVMGGNSDSAAGGPPGDSLKSKKKKGRRPASALAGGINPRGHSRGIRQAIAMRGSAETTRAAASTAAKARPWTAKARMSSGSRNNGFSRSNINSRSDITNQRPGSASGQRQAGRRGGRPERPRTADVGGRRPPPTGSTATTRRSSASESRMRRRSARGARGGGGKMRRPASAGFGGAPISLIPPGLAGRPGRSNSNPSSSGHNHQLSYPVGGRRGRHNAEGGQQQDGTNTASGDNNADADNNDSIDNNDATSCTTDDEEEEEEKREREVMVKLQRLSVLGSNVQEDEGKPVKKKKKPRKLLPPPNDSFRHYSGNRTTIDDHLARMLHLEGVTPSPTTTDDGAVVWVSSLDGGGGQLSGVRLNRHDVHLLRLRHSSPATTAKHPPNREVKQARHKQEAAEAERREQKEADTIAEENYHAPRYRFFVYCASLEATCMCG